MFLCLDLFGFLFFFFFKQKTAYEMRISDWSSDVCSSDLRARRPRSARRDRAASRKHRQADRSDCRTSGLHSLLASRNAKDAGERNLANQRYPWTEFPSRMSYASAHIMPENPRAFTRTRPQKQADRKSTRLNSSH